MVFNVEPGGYDEVVLRGDAAGQFVAFWLAAGRVQAGMTVNTWDAVPAIEALIRSRAVLDAHRLGDADVPLEDLVGLGGAVGG